MKTQVRHIYLDLDGVLADWHGRVLELFNHTKAWKLGDSIYEYLGVSRFQISHAISMEGMSFWQNLKPLPWFSHLIDTVSFYSDFSIATRPSRDPISATGKMQWMYKHLSGDNNKEFRRFAIIEDKFRLAKTGTILIDDDEEQCNNFTEHGGLGILFPRIWNANYRHSSFAVEYVRNKINDYCEGR